MTSETRQDGAMTDDADRDLPEHVRAQPRAWDARRRLGRRRARAAGPPTSRRWGIFGVPEAQVGVLPADLAGLDTIELGCGTGYVSAWLARRGARPVGIDNSARAAGDRAAPPGGARHRLPAHPRQRRARAAARRQLRPRDLRVRRAHLGRPVRAGSPRRRGCCAPAASWSSSSTARCSMLTVPDDEADGPPSDRLLRPYFGMHRFEWPDDDAVEFHLGYGDWIRAAARQRLRGRGPDRGAPAPGRDDELDLVTPEWARAVAGRGDLEGADETAGDVASGPHCGARMNVVFLSPHFPPNWYRFVVALRSAGANTLGIADSNWDDLRPELRDALNDYYRVDDLGNYDQLDPRAGLLHPSPRPDRPARLAQRALARDRGARCAPTSTSRASTSATIAAIKRKSLMKQRFRRPGSPVARGEVCRTPAAAASASSARSATRSWPSPTSASARRETYKLETTATSSATWATSRRSTTSSRSSSAARS